VRDWGGRNRTKKDGENDRAIESGMGGLVRRINLMPQNIQVRFEIPFVNCHFWGWLPLEKEDEVFVNDESNLSLIVQFTQDGVLFPPGEAPQLNQEKNYSFRIIKAIVNVENVPEEMIRGIHNNTNDVGAVNSQKEFAKQILDFLASRINRIIEYARYHKGQYWISDIKSDPMNPGNAYREYKSQMKIGEQDWSPWNPYANEYVIILKELDQNRCLHRNDWPKLKEYVTGSAKPPFIRHILANAEWHADQGHLRVALTEGVAALESAIDDLFQQSSIGKKWINSLKSGRLKLESLHKVVEKFGLRGTLEVLFPIIFLEDKLPTKLLNSCIDAVNLRQNVVHNKARSLDKNKVQLYLDAIRKICDFLEGLEE
jgi:hypothetical protein